MRKWMDRLFARYGSEAVLSGQSTRKVRVFFESVNSKSKQHMQTHRHPLGQLPQGQYICRFPWGTAVVPGDTLRFRGKSYEICRVEEMLGAGCGCYLWALCVRKGREEP
jgi:hypothetical protein